MAAPVAQPVTMDTPISVRVTVQGVTRKFKIPLGEMTPMALPAKLRSLLNIPDSQPVIFERFSDSSAAFIILDPHNVAVYKTLFRAAKAKLKLRLRATIPGVENVVPVNTPAAPASLYTTQGLPANASASSLPVNPEQKTPDRSLPPQSSAETLVPIASEPQKVEVPKAADINRLSSRLSRESFFAEIANLSRQRELALRVKNPMQAPAAVPNPAPMPTCTWSVFCNACDRPMADEHYHCNICDEGDYDLCNTCVNAGIHCHNEEHWLLKRFVKNGIVVNSTTERHVSGKRVNREKTIVPEVPLPEMPGAFTEEKKVDEAPKEPAYDSTRTCNCCVREDKDSKFVTCDNCPDYDLCIPCHEANMHGHHPGHKFRAVSGEITLTPLAEFLCAPGRNTRHSALCDGCDKPIFGVRHKCLNCPDWDYCSECVKNAPMIHPGHRFAPLYDPIPAPRYRKTRHVGIYCDGPLCESKHEYIEGVRYKCAICHDTDFCGDCEAYPHNKHNHTHPLIQFKTPVRNATITTVHEDQYGSRLSNKGDVRASPSAAKAPANAATQVQTIIDVKPAEPAAPKTLKDRIEIKDLLAEPIQEKIRVQDLLSTPIAKPVAPVDVNKLSAVFISETMKDETRVAPNAFFRQVWTLHNPGPAAWPAGCSVRYTGGDHMFQAADEASEVESNIIDRPVEAGEYVNFEVPLQSPSTHGAKISYWRLKTSDGQAFGHRLWCHIAVVPVELMSLPQAVAPAPPVAPIVRGNAWHDNFLQMAVEHRLNRTQAIEKQRVELERIRKAHLQKMAADAEAKAKRSDMLRRLSEQINMKQAALQTAAQEAVPSTSNETPVSELPAPPTFAPVVPALQGSALYDYQLQLMLLEQQNKKRLLMARNEQDGVPIAAAVPPAAPVEVEADFKPVTVEETVDEEDVKVEQKSEEKIEEKPEEKSNMIFPKLDKESPVSSTHDIAAAPSVKTEDNDAEIFEDAESVSLVESSDDDAGFMTDEEYDILDASDEEFTV